MNKEAFLGIFLIVMAIMVIFMIVKAIWRAGMNSASSTIRHNLVDRLNSRRDFAATHVAYCQTTRQLLAIDGTSFLVTQYFEKGNQVFVRNISIDQILRLELLIDEGSTTTSLGSAIVGEESILTSAKAFSHQYVSSIALRFYIDDLESPIFDHAFLSSNNYGKFEASSHYVKEALQEASKTKAILEVLMHRHTNSSLAPSAA